VVDDAKPDISRRLNKDTSAVKIVPGQVTPKKYSKNNRNPAWGSPHQVK